MVHYYKTKLTNLYLQKIYKTQRATFEQRAKQPKPGG